MKIDRLFGITIYMLNHGIVKAKVLADKFEVSSRTITRDIETLCMAGIPITAVYGVNGGYKILENYRMNSQLMNQEDYSYILTALKGLDSGYHNKKIQETLEKIKQSTPENKQEQNLVLDFSAMHEGLLIDEYLNLLNKAMILRNRIEFDYTNSYGYTSRKQLEPVALKYKWYAWYLLGYNIKGKKYRWYKVIRMRDLIMTDISFQLEHEPADVLLQRYDEEDKTNYIQIKLKCNSNIKVQAEEYLKGTIISENKDYFILTLNMPEYERMWYSLLLGFGNSIEVLEPESVRQRLVKTAEEIINVYQNEKVLD